MKPQHWIFLIILIVTSALVILRTGNISPRVEQNIDLNWRFMAGDDSSYRFAEYDDLDWRIVTLPHDWMIEQEPLETNPSGTAGGFYPGGIAWYRKHLDLTGLEKKEQFYLVFDGVYMNADVWVNDQHVGHQMYGYMGFNIDISDVILNDTINTIAVRTNCSELPSDRWYSGAGIYRHVKLIACKKIHFPVYHSKLTHSSSEEGYNVNSTVQIRNEQRRSRRIKTKSVLISPEGKMVSSTTSSRTVPRRGSLELSEQHLVEDPDLWSATNPGLYTINTMLIYKRQVIDNISTQFGLRDIAFSPDSGFIINGKKEWLKGVCLHHDGGAIGAAVPEATWEYRLRILKELGVNALRLAHNPHDPEMLDLCDRLGFYVIDEMYDKWELTWEGTKGPTDFMESYTVDLANFVRRDQNHPCVIAWSVGNETLEQRFDPELGVEWYTKLSEVVKSIDTTRAVTCGLHPGYGTVDEAPSSYIRVNPLVNYNYRSDSFASWHAQHPELIWLASETKVYQPNKVWDYSVIDHSANSWNDMEPFVAGQFIWAGIDYFGESSGWPNRSFNSGLLSTNGFIKPYAYYTQSLYSDEPMVKLTVVDNTIVDSLNSTNNWQRSWAGSPVSRHWNFEKGEELQVLIYTNCQFVELWLNDSLLTRLRKNDFPDGVPRYKLSYEEGMLKALALATSGGNIRVSDSLQTAGEAAKIVLSPDKKVLIADGKDVLHIETSVTDREGILQPESTHLISYKVEGPGKLRVIDNGDPADHTAVSATSKPVVNGRQLLIVQSTMEPGDLIISANAAGLEAAQLKVKSVREK